MTNPRISVIISTYNRKKRLQKAINSVLEQTYKDFELIIVSDGSKDGTGEMVTKIKDPRIRYISRDKNFGTDTRPKNDGIRAAKGDFLAFLDDDNVWLADHLMILWKEHERNPKFDVLYGDRMIIDEDKEVPSQVGTNSDFNIVILFDRNYIDTSDVMVRKSVLYEVGGFDERYRKFIDWNLWIRLAKAGKKFFHVGKVITEYHLHKDSKSLTVKEGTIGQRPIEGTAFEPVFRPVWDPFTLEIYVPYLTGQKWMPRIAVFTLTYNRLELTKVMHKSLSKSGYPYDWFVVDQGSTDGTVEWLKSLVPIEGDRTSTWQEKNGNLWYMQNNFPNNVLILYNKKNKGISIGSNQAINTITSMNYDFIIKIDNDCEILSDNWLKKMLEIYQSHYMICLSPRVEGLVDNPGGMPRIAYRSLKGHTIGVTTHIGGIFTMTHKMAYEGWRWDEDDFLHALQDIMFTQHVQEIGFLVGYIEDLRCMHQMTTEGQRKAFPEYFKKREEERTQVYEK